MKWLDRKKDPLPLGDAFIAVINLRADSPYLHAILLVKVLKHIEAL